jgi:hypothetical protein
MSTVTAYDEASQEVLFLKRKRIASKNGESVYEYEAEVYRLFAHGIFTHYHVWKLRKNYMKGLRAPKDAELDVVWKAFGYYRRIDRDAVSFEPYAETNADA